MSKLEQKMFFTRHGVFTIWEMLNHLSEEMYNQLYIYALGKRLVNTRPRNNEEFPNFFYKLSEDLEGDIKKEFNDQIKTLFLTRPKPMFDFNAILYQFIGDMNNSDTINQKLSMLRRDVNEFGVEGLKISYNIFSTVKKQPIIDVKFSSQRPDFFKGNKNEISLNTEIRIFLECNIALVTNYSNFTHTNSQKELFVKKVLECILVTRGEVKPTKLKDQSLRSLLLVEGSIPSKLKFNIDGMYQVGVDILNPTDIKDTIAQNELKQLYERHQISHVKVTISEVENKVLMIDGFNGKLISRAKTLLPQDINDFIYQLTDLLKYDYLNFNFKKDLITKANGSLISTFAGTENLLKTCYKNLRECLNDVCNDETGVFVDVLENSFYFCLIRNIKLASQIESELAFDLDPTVIETLSKICNYDKDSIIDLLKRLLHLYGENKNSLEKFLEQIDRLIKSAGMIPNDISV
ncbi:hypothetical protein [Bacillus sp. FJAT-45350]|uniref:hypothetical protein n=1 Tax=Bacillus sp. FJAT-45350 TaxID=2011014 RepID=UPI000BB9413C|nr:hypothetical protein [Bacillus sp. FJAT-45350]